MYENALELHQMVMQAWQEHLGVPLLISSVLYVKSPRTLIQPQDQIVWFFQTVGQTHLASVEKC